MLNQQDTTTLNKAALSANHLAQDVQAMMTTDNPLLAEIILGILEEALVLEQKLNRLATITQS